VVQPLEEQFQTRLGARMNPRQPQPEGNIFPNPSQWPPEITDNPSIFSRFLPPGVIEGFGTMGDAIQSYAVDPLKEYLAPKDLSDEKSYDPFYDPYGEKRDSGIPGFPIPNIPFHGSPFGEISFPAAGMPELLDENQMNSILRFGAGMAPFYGSAFEWDEMGPKMRALSIGTDLLDIPTAGAGGAATKAGIKLLPDAINVLKDVTAPLVRNIPEILSAVGPILIRKTNTNRLEWQGDIQDQISKGTNVLSSTTDDGKYLVEDVSVMSRALAGDPSRASGGGRLMQPGGIYGKSYAFSHSEPIFDIIDSTTNKPIMRVTLHPSFNETYRFGRFDEYDEWALWTDVPWYNQLKPHEFYKNKRDWNMDVSGMGEGTREGIDIDGYQDLISGGFQGFEGDDEYWEALAFSDLARKGAIPNRKDMLGIGEAIGVRLNATSLTGVRIPSGLKGARLQQQKTETIQKMLDVQPRDYMTKFEVTRHPDIPLSQAKKDMVMDYWEDVFDHSVGIPSALDNIADEAKISGLDPASMTGEKVNFLSDLPLGHMLPELATVAPFSTANPGLGPTIRWGSKDFSMDDVVNSYLGDVIEKNMNESRELVKKLNTEYDIFNVDPTQYLTDYQIMVLWQTAKHEARAMGDVPSQVFTRLVDDHSTKAWQQLEMLERTGDESAVAVREIYANGYGGVENNPVLNAYFDPDLSKATKKQLEHMVTTLHSGTSGYASGVQSPSLFSKRPQKEAALIKSLQTNQGSAQNYLRDVELDERLIPFQELQLPRELP
jgi:hypothetical protein